MAQIDWWIVLMSLFPINSAAGILVLLYFRSCDREQLDRIEKILDERGPIIREMERALGKAEQTPSA